MSTTATPTRSGASAHTKVTEARVLLSEWTKIRSLPLNDLLAVGSGRVHHRVRCAGAIGDRVALAASRPARSSGF